MAGASEVRFSGQTTIRFACAIGSYAARRGAVLPGTVNNAEMSATTVEEDFTRNARTFFANLKQFKSVDDALGLKACAQIQAGNSSGRDGMRRCRTLGIEDDDST